MGTFFTNEYKKYYDSLINAKSIVDSANALQEKADNLFESTERLIKMLENSNWDEQGIMHIKEVIMPSIKYDIATLNKEDILRLKIAAIKSINELLPLLEELKTLDEQYESARAVKKEDRDESLVANLHQKAKAKVKEVDAKILEIKELDLGNKSNGRNYNNVNVSGGKNPELPNLINVIFDNKDNNAGNFPGTISKLPSIIIPPSTTGGICLGPDCAGTISSSSSGSYRPSIDNSTITPPTIDSVVPIDIKTLDPNLATNPNLVRKGFGGINYYVVKTKFDVGSYADLAYRVGIRQNFNRKKYGGACLAFSYVHAYNLYSGYGGDNAEIASKYKYAGRFRDFFNDSKKETLLKIYQEITNGRPVVMQVNGNAAGTSRHFVTVVGFKDTVQGPDSLTDKDLLIMDSWDAKIERMDTSGSRFMTTGAQTRKKYSGYYLRVLA